LPARFAGAIDCDLHTAVPHMSVLKPYLADYWREMVSWRGLDRYNFALTGNDGGDFITKTFLLSQQWNDFALQSPSKFVKCVRLEVHRDIADKHGQPP